MYGRTGLVLVLPAAAAVAVAVAGCGSSGNASAGTSSTPTTATSSASTPATVTDTVVPPASTTTATATSAAPSATGPMPCATANLTVSLGSSEGAAGTEYYAVHFVNKGPAACTISAYPGVSFVAPGNGAEVGPAATRVSGGRTPTTVTLSVGAEATSSVGAAEYLNFPASTCAATAISGFRVYPPNNKAAAYVVLPGATKACSQAQQLTVFPVVAGAAGTAGS